MTIGNIRTQDNDSLSNNLEMNANFTTMNSIYIAKLSEQTYEKARIIGTAKHTERGQLSGEGYLTQRMGTIRKGLPS
jgi:hypothetical protein